MVQQQKLNPQYTLSLKYYYYMKTLIFLKKLPASGIPGTYALSIKIICTPWKSRETIPLRVHFLLILFINS